MFSKHPSQPVTVNGLTFRKKGSREGDSTTIAEVTFEVPLTWGLANDVLEGMAEDLFSSPKKPKLDMTDASFRLPAMAYLFTVRPTEKGRAQKISGCTLRSVGAYKAGGKPENDWLLRFTVAFLMLSAEEMAPFLKGLFGSLYVTFEEQEPAMDFEPPAEGEGTEARVNRRGEVEQISDRKKH